MENEELLKAIRQIVRAENQPLKDELASVKERLSAVENHVGNIDTRLGTVEDHVGGIDAQMGDVKDRTARTEVLLEHEIPKQVRLLAEGHEAILARLPEADEIDGIRSRVRTLERVTAEHTAEINALKQSR